MKETINMLFKKSALVLAASLLAVGSAQAVLPNATANLSVTILVATSNLSTSCSLHSGSAAGSLIAPSVSASYTSGSTTDVMSYPLLKVQCNGNDTVPFTVSAGAGNNSNGTTRRASANAGADFINYKLQTYSPMAMGYAAWDDATTPAFGGSPMTGTTSLFTGATTSASTLGFQLLVPAGQAAPQGTYTDVVLLTATF